MIIGGCDEELRNPVDGSETAVQEMAKPITVEEVMAIKSAAEASEQPAPEGTSWITVAYEALSWVGVPYRWGGNSRSGVDCSHLVYQVYRNSRAAYGSYLTVAMIKQSPYFAEVTYPSPGDLILFRKKIGGYEHVGIYLWHGYFIHASYGAGKVVIDHIDNSPYYGQGFWRQYQPYFVRWMLGIA